MGADSDIAARLESANSLPMISPSAITL